MPRHSVVERSRIAFSMKIFLETAPVEAANSASSWRILHCVASPCHSFATTYMTSTPRRSSSRMRLLTGAVPFDVRNLEKLERRRCSAC